MIQQSITSFATFAFAESQNLKTAQWSHTPVKVKSLNKMLEHLQNIKIGNIQAPDVLIW